MYTVILIGCILNQTNEVENKILKMKSFAPENETTNLNIQWVRSASRKTEPILAVKRNSCMVSVQNNDIATVQRT